MKQNLVIVGLFLLTLSVLREKNVAHAAAASPPLAAKTVGYLLNSFHSEFRDDMDLHNKKTGNFSWFVGRWFGASPTRSDRMHFQPGEGITLTDGGDQGNYTIGSAAYDKARSPRHWVGTAFGGGGYFEAELKFDTAAVIDRRAIGFPAWWLEPIEHMADPKADQWVGQVPGYEHFTEVDIFEYNQWNKHAPNFYSGAVHVWYGVYNKTCPPQFCRVSNMNGMSQFDNYVIEV